MKIVDVTLRDGGFCNDFNWTLEYAKKHYQTISNLDIQYCELGYWKQTKKSTNQFYNLNEDLVEKITHGESGGADVVTMIDYHYCSKNLSDYPKKLETPLTMIRITSRKEDLVEALDFVQRLKDKTNIDISFQIINSTNYSNKELFSVIEKVKSTNVEVVSFADSHGNLNLIDDWEKYSDSILLLKENNIKTGFHLHNHTGRALTNFLIAKKNGVDILDASVKGLGKGAGNLKLEEIIINEKLIKLLDHMVNSDDINIKININSALNIITGRLNVTDNYTKNAINNKISLDQFWTCCKKLNGKDKDSYNPESFDEIYKKLFN
jgi:4-hydroxy 2-oxovalerate aldolase